MTSHLRVVAQNSDQDIAREHRQAILDELVDTSASRYYHRVSKPSAPLYRELDDQHQEEYRAFVRPIVLAALEDAISLGLHHEGDRP